MLEPNARSASAASTTSPAAGAGPPGQHDPSQEPHWRDAQALHERLVKLHRASSRLRREFFGTLLRLQESRLYLRLGFSSIEQYAERLFGYGRTETYDSLRVAAALRKLPRSRDAFDRGEISWSALKEITRVAEAETEEVWIERAGEVSSRRIRAEVEDALRRGRKLPRGKGEGLPEPTFRVSFELRAEEYDLVEKALGKLRWDMAARIGAGAESAAEDAARAGPAAGNTASRLPDSKEALVLMARLVLGSDPAGIPEGRVPREDPLFTVLYHVCPRCDEASLPGPDGPVRIGREVVERVEPEAKRVVVPAAGGGESRESEAAGVGGEGAPAGAAGRDRPNTPTLTRRLLLREGRVCANPCCRRRLGLQGHHIVFRSCGGKTELGNEVGICGICHTLVHQGWLRIEGSPGEGIRFVPAAREIEVPLEDHLQLLAKLEIPELPARRDGRAAGEGTALPQASGRPDSLGRRGGSGPAGSGTQEDLARALLALGYGRREASERVQRASERLREKLGREATAEEILRLAVAC